MQIELERLESFPYEDAINSGMAYEVASDMLCVPFWKEEFCQLVCNAAEENGKFEPLETDLGPYGSAPGQELRVSKLSEKLFSNYKRHWMNVLRPVVEFYYRSNIILHRNWDVFRDPFILRYSMDTQTEMDEHTDASLLTIAIKLNNEFTGNDLYFPRQDFSNKDIPVGWGLLFPGQLTHPHYVRPLTSGKRYSMTGWIRGTDLKNIEP